MPKQLNLFLPKAGLHIEPRPDCHEPRLWIRRLVLWSAPGVILRSIQLRPGLNIIWSPDFVDQPKAKKAKRILGHGSGKTLFCRLLRYCLGEDRFASDEQRHSIARAFPKGSVGAEIMVDGNPWAILRPIGTGRQHYAIPHGNLDDIAAGEFDHTGMEPLLEAIENGILSNDVVAHIPGDRSHHAWLVALAWLSRDQECRFDHVLAWRSPVSDSGSPIRSLSLTNILDSLRVLIGAIDPQELKLRTEIIQQEAELKEVTQEIGHLQWESAQIRSRMTQLGVERLPPGRMGIESLREAAKAESSHLATIASSSIDTAALQTLRKNSEEAQQRVQGLSKSLAEIETRIPEIERLISYIKGELPALSFSAFKSNNPQCPICEIPVDRALAEGCKLSHKLPNSEEIKARWDARQLELNKESYRLKQEQEKLPSATNELASARKVADELLKRLRTAEKTRETLKDVDRLEEVFSAREQQQLRADRMGNAIEAKRQQAGAYRDAKAEVLHRVSKCFNAIIRKIVGPDAKGKITLDGNGLKLSVKMGGERSTAAIDSLKVIAFDLAVLCLSIEGETNIPAFLIHDSPREADLGLSIYHQLFHFAHDLEKVGDQPLFQYILTTTTRPPKEFLKEPWLRDTIGGQPAEARLLKRDL